MADVCLLTKPDIGSAGASANEPAATPAAEVPSPPAVPQGMLERVAEAPYSTAVVVIAVVAVVFALHWARTFFVSLLLGVLIAYAFSPVVALLERGRVPRWLASCLVVLALCGAGVFAAGMLGGQIRAVIEDLPEAARKASARIVGPRDGKPSALEKVQAAAREIEKATERVTGAPVVTPKPAAPVVVVEPAGFRLSTVLWANVASVTSFAGQAIMVLFLVFFLLLSGDTFKRKMMRLAGPSLERKKVTLKVLEDINASIQNFMFMLFATNLLLVILSWIAFWMIGLENAGAWALAAGLLHLVPYVGSAILAAALGVCAFMQFGTLSMAMTTVLVSAALAGAVGMLMATWMTGRQASMNSAAVFVSLLFWGWLWGVWGLLLAIPITVAVKVISEKVEPLQPVAELLRA